MLTPAGVTLADYNSAILSGNSTHVRIVFPVQNVTLTEADISADNGIHINTVLNTETDLIIGKAVASEIVISFINNGQFAGFDWTEEFHVDFGVDINGSTNWVTVGYFTGKKPDRTVRTETIEFTAYDRMTKFDVLADDYISGLTFPKTMTNLFQGLCTHLGLTYAAGDEVGTTMAMSYAENPFSSGLTCRQMLAWIAEANGCYARITADGKVKLVWYKDHTSDYTLDGDHYFEINIDEATAPVVDTIRISSTEDENAGAVYPVGTPVETYNIIDNPLTLALSGANRTTVMTSILSRFTTFGTYTPMSVTAIGNWLVEAGDIIEVDEKGTTINMPVFSRTLEWTGGCFDAYVCTGETTRTEMTESAKAQYETGGKLANKYTIQSGIDITDEGVTVSGGKYIKLISGGILDVQSLNFIIDSVNGVVSSGNWTFDNGGLYLTKKHTNTYQGGTEHTLGLMFGARTPKTGVENIAYVDFEPFDRLYNQTYSGMVVGFKNSSESLSSQLQIRSINRYSPTPWPVPPGSPLEDMAILPRVGDWCLGASDAYFTEGFFQHLYFPLNGTPTDLVSLYNLSTGTIAKSSNITDGTLGNNVCRKVGNTVFASARIHTMAEKSANGVFMTVPSGFRPKVSYYFCGYMFIVSFGHMVPCIVEVMPNGNVEFTYSASMKATQVMFSGSWSVI